MSRRVDPREAVAAILAGIFLFAFILLFVWLIFLTWTARGRLPQFVQGEMFTHVTTSMVGLVGGIAAAWMGHQSGSSSRVRSTLGWVFVAVYFVLGMAALLTLLLNIAQGIQASMPEALKNLGTVSFGLAIATVGAYLSGR